VRIAPIALSTAQVVNALTIGSHRHRLAWL
jgi:hypothetical protein